MRIATRKNDFELYADKLIATCEEMDTLLDVFSPAYVKTSKNLDECYQKLCVAQRKLAAMSLAET